MTHKRKAIALLTAFALLATGVFVTGGVQAHPLDGVANFSFTCLNGSTREHCEGDGVQAAVHNGSETLHTWKAGFATVQCTELTSDVTTDSDGNSATLPTEPTYNTSCIANPGALTVHIFTHGCEFEYFVEKSLGNATTEDEYEGSMSIVGCDSPEHSITIEITEGGSARCIIHIPEQGTIKPIFFRNMTTSSPKDVTIEAKEAVLTSEFTPFGGGLLSKCGVLNANANSKFNGNTTVTAKNPTTLAALDFQID